MLTTHTSYWCELLVCTPQPHALLYTRSFVHRSHRQRKSRIATSETVDVPLVYKMKYTSNQNSDEKQLLLSDAIMYADDA